MKNYWKITNVSKNNEIVKMIIKTSSTTSKGIVLNPKEIIIAEAQPTATIDAQVRRGFITIDKNFDNSIINLSIGESLTEGSLLSKMELAEKMAKDYISKN